MWFVACRSILRWTRSIAREDIDGNAIEGGSVGVGIVEVTVCDEHRVDAHVDLPDAVGPWSAKASSGGPIACDYIENVVGELDYAKAA